MVSISFFVVYFGFSILLEKIKINKIGIKILNFD